MPGSRDAKSAKSLSTEVEEMKIEESKETTSARASPKSTMADEQASSSDGAGKSGAQRRVKLISEPLANQTSAEQSPGIKAEEEHEETIGGEVTLKMEAGKPKLSRKSSQKVIAKPPALFSHLPDATDEAKASFEVILDCNYANKGLGSTEPALDCDCAEEWDRETQTNHACGEDSDCINRATKMECSGDCGCGASCQNQRFEHKQYANVSVIKTEKKGYGLRANKDLKPNDFIFEYIGEVIPEPAFRRRMHQYDQEGIKHFYFMSLTKAVFVDATKKGNLGRFCNHSCNPNCFVDKWVVGDKLRMGIFAERHIQAGEELVFNYNVDRYGADPQPCYCGEPNCSGFIGGKTQTDDDRATQLSLSVQMALGIDSADDWNDAVPKPKRKKKVAEEDEEYIESVELKPLDLVACVPLMAELYKNQEKWIIVKCLERIQSSHDQRIYNRVAALHGYIIMNRIMKEWIDDVNLVLQVFDVIHKIPSSTKNKIIDAKIEETVAKLQDSSDERVSTQAAELLEQWSKLAVAYRIPRLKRDPNATVSEKRPDRPERRDRDRSRSRSRSRSKSVEVPKAPSGPRSNIPQRGGSSFHPGSRPPFKRPNNGALPPGWFEAVTGNGSTYFYNASGATTWQRPTLPAMTAPPPPPPKAISDAQVLQNLINAIVAKPKASTQQDPSSTSATPQETPQRDSHTDKWRSWPIEKQKKLYENTLFPLINQVMKDFRGRLDHQDVKRFGKEIGKKLVESDFRKNRVTDPSKIEPKMKKQILKYTTEYFEKAVVKRKEHDKRKAEREQGAGSKTPAASPPTVASSTPYTKDDEPMPLAENRNGDSSAKLPLDVMETVQSPSALKRRRDEQETVAGAEDDAASKKPRTEMSPVAAPPPPPPPPPPPAEEDTVVMGAAVMERTPSEEPATSPSANEEGPGFTIKGIARASSRMNESPTQVATPPTTGSPDNSERGKKKTEYTGMNAERIGRMNDSANR